MPVSKLAKRIAHLGYGSRKDILAMLQEGRVSDPEGRVFAAGDDPAHEQIRVDGTPLDPPTGMLVMLHKPLGHTCSRSDLGPLVFSLLPARFRARKPALSTVGRLDRDTSGLLLLTDDGSLLHRIIAPKSQVGKVYEASLAESLRGDEAELFASGELLLKGEDKPLRAVQARATGSHSMRLVLHEGRYHQVRRMFAAAGNHVESLHRSQIGGLGLGDLAEGEWRVLDPSERAAVFSHPACETP